MKDIKELKKLKNIKYAEGLLDGSDLDEMENEQVSDMYSKYFSVQRDGDRFGVLFGVGRDGHYVMYTELPKGLNKNQRLMYVLEKGEYVNSHEVYDEDTMISYLEFNFNFNPETGVARDVEPSLLEDYNREEDKAALRAKIDNSGKIIVL